MAKMLFPGRLGLGFLFLLAFLIPVPASPPARVSYVDGTAAVAQEGDVDWLEISVNMPVRPDDRIVLQEDGLLELELGSGNVLRLGSNTDAVFEELSGSELRLSLTSGTMILRIRESLSALVTTPSARLTFPKAGLYRVGVTAGGSVQVAVRKGEAEAVTEAASRTLTSGEVLGVTNSYDRLAQVSLIDLKDDLDLWSDRRDAARVSSRSASYVGNGYSGTYDLDRYGGWDYDDNYGWVWWPSVNISWCPYQIGEWQYYSSWGWTWVSYEPWGWLPYHYGRWVYSSYRSRWCWTPYEMTGWSPALVVFYSDHNSVGWAPRTFDDDRRGNRRIIEIPRAGLTSEDRDEFLRRARFRGDRRRAADEVPLPGTEERVPVPARRLEGSATRLSEPLTIGAGESDRQSRPGQDVSRSGFPAGLPRRDASRSAGQPRVITIGPTRPPAAAGSYPDRRNIQRLPSEALLERRRSERFGYGSGSTGSPGHDADRGVYGPGIRDPRPADSRGGWWIPAAPSPENRSLRGVPESQGRERMAPGSGPDPGRGRSYERPARREEPRQKGAPVNQGGNASGRSDGRESGDAGSRTPRRDR